MKNDLFDFRVKEYIPHDLTDDNLTTCQAYAKEHDLRVETPNSKQLFIDIDHPDDYETFRRRFEILLAFDLVEDFYRETKSKSGNTHIVAVLKESVTPTERILLQAVLGSDGNRELLSYIRVRKGDPNPTIFFETK